MSPKSRILIAGQAPGRKVHGSGIPFKDASGDRLRDWLGVSKATFYDPEKFAILPMGFCYPGTGKSGDLPPRPECAPAWRPQLMAGLAQLELVIVIGQYAQAYHLSNRKKTLTETVRAWEAYWPKAIPLPHPSPRNNIWLRRNPWFETDVLPILKAGVAEILSDPFPLYDQIGQNYSVMRQTDPQIAEQLNTELQDATRIVNIGAGTGSYEPEGLELVAVEPSAEMIAQRQKGAHPVRQAFAEKLPFADNSFSHAMTVLSMHHWTDKARAFGEINRVATEKFVAITWDPEAEPFWLTRDYFPEIHAMDVPIFPKMAAFSDYFDEVEIRPLRIPADCQDGFFAAFWKRPQAYLNPQVRQSMSPFAKIKELSAGLQKLEADLASGAWAQKNKALLTLSHLDCGYRLISAKVRHP